jgi:hypothetical protein
MSGHFEDFELSVHLQRLTTVEAVMSGNPGQYLGFILAKTPREHGNTVAPDPTDTDQSHTLVCGRKSRILKRLLASEFKWIEPPAR